MGFILVYVLNENYSEANKIIFHLLERNMIACANSFPVNSAFWWQGEVNNEEEVASVLKTKKQNREKVKEEILRIHFYETPCIIKFEVEANEGFEEWVNSET